MLQNIRDKLQGHRWLSYVVLGALAVVFTAWGAYGIVDLSLGPPKYAAKVNGQEIAVSEVQRVWQDRQPQYLRLFGGDVPDAQRKVLQDQILDAFVRNAALEQRAHDAGIRVSDAQVIKAFQAEPAFQVDGKFSPEMARARLAQVGLSENAYVADQRRTLGVGQLEQTVVATDFMTPLEIARLFALENEQRELRYAVLPAERFAGTAPVPDAEVQAYYKAHEADFQTTETVKLAYAQLDLVDVEARTTVNDVDLQANYDKNRQRYVEPERRRVRHILLEVADAKDDGAVRKKAEDLVAQLRAGADFAALAKQHSQDAGSAQQGGELGLQERATLEGPFATALFALQKAGDISEPVKSDSGYHIIQVEEIQPGKEKTFAEARPELEQELKRQQAVEQFGDTQEKLQQRIERGVTDLAKLAEQFQLRTGEMAKFARGSGGGEPFGSNAELNQTVFSEPVLLQNQVGGPVALGEDRLVFVKALDHQKPQLRPLAEVRDTIVAELTRQRGTQAARNAAEQAAQRLQAAATDPAAFAKAFEKEAATLGVHVDGPKFVGRGDPELPAQVRDFAFAAPKPAGDGAAKAVVKALALDAGGAAVVAVTGARVPPDDGNIELKQQRVKQELTRQGTADMDAYVSELVRNAKVRKNSQAFE